MSEHISHSDLDELARLAVGLRDTASPDQLEMILRVKLGVGFEEFGDVVNAIIQFTVPVKDKLSGKLYHSFVCDGRMVARMEVDQDGD